MTFDEVMTQEFDQHALKKMSVHEVDMLRVFYYAGYRAGYKDHAWGTAAEQAEQSGYLSAEETQRQLQMIDPDLYKRDDVEKKND